MKHLFIAVPILFCLLANCAPVKSLEQIPDSRKLLSYERTPCFGFCQTYQVTVLGNGRAFFVGRQYVPVLDTIEISLPDQIVDRLDAILRHPDYLDYELEEPEYQITDIPGLNFIDFKNQREYELDMIIPPAIDQMANIVDEVLTEHQLIYDRSTYPTINEEILVSLKSGTDPNSLSDKNELYEIQYQKEIGAGIYLYSITFSILQKEKAFKAIDELNGVQAVQINHRLQRR